MSDAVADEQLPAKRGRSRLLLAGLIVAGAAAGFATGFMGYVSPSALIVGAPAEDHGHEIGRAHV